MHPSMLRIALLSCFGSVVTFEDFRVYVSSR